MTETQLTVLAGLPASDQADALVDTLAGRFELIGRVDDVATLVEQGVDVIPDVVVVHDEIGSPLAELARDLHERIPASRMVVIAPGDNADAIEAVRAGAFSVIEPDAEPSRVADAVKGSARGESVLSAFVADAVLAEMSTWATSDPNPTLRCPTLTMTETEVLRQLAKGRTPREIAAEHDVTERLVNLHVGYAVAKLQMHLARARKLIAR